MKLPRTVRSGDLAIGPEAKLMVLAGLCIVEDFETTLRHAESLKAMSEDLPITLVFKSSFDKANRSSINSHRGPGMKAGLEILAEVKKRTGLPLVTDVHESSQVAEAAEIADIIQIPAFLCRQTDLLVAAAESGRIVNVKKGQFLSPHDMVNVVNKIQEAGSDKVTLTERGNSFGYNTLVNDFRGLPIMRGLGAPVIFDATHSVQQPGGLGNVTGGDRTMVPYLAKAAVAVGVDGLFFEVHETPDKAKSDAANALHLEDFGPLMKKLLAIREAAAD